MKYYRTLNGLIFDLDELEKEEKSMYRQVKDYYEQNPPRHELSNYWQEMGKTVWGSRNMKEVVKSPIFKICHDMSLRLAVQQGIARLHDYRDELLDIIEDNFSSRKRFCEEIGVDEAFLSRVRSKDDKLSIRELETILDGLGYEMRFAKKVELSPLAK